MTTQYECRVTQWTVVPIGEPTFSEMATVVSIDDESGGEFVVVKQSGRVDLSKIAINPDEWPALRKAIDTAIKQCRQEESAQ